MRLYYRKSLPLVLPLLSIILILSGCGRHKEEASEQAIPVKVKKIQLGVLRNALDYVGDIEAQDEAVVYPKVDGKIIEKLKKV